MIALVTGGLGFQGSHLARHWLSKGHTVRVLNTLSPRARAMESRLLTDNMDDVRRLTICYGSVTDPEIVQKAMEGVDVVAHLAAWTSVDQSFKHPRAAWSVNSEASYTVLEAVRLYAPTARVLWASSCEVYGHVGATPAAEDAAMRPHSPYAAAKVAGDRLAYSYRTTYGLPITILRPCNVYGPWQKEGAAGAVIPTFISAARKGNPLLVSGTGEQRREFLHVDDVVRAYDLLWNNYTDRDTVNVGSGETASVLDLAQRIVTYFQENEQRKVRIEFNVLLGRPGEVYSFNLDSSRMHSLGWRPKISLSEGLWSLLRG